MGLSNTTRLKGLYTFGNEIIHPEGSCSVADNINIDEPNVITQRRGFNDFADLIPSSLTRIRQLLQYKDTPIRHFNGNLEFYRANIFNKFDGTYNEVDPDIRIKYIEASSNLYFTTSDGIKKISALSSDDFSTSPGYIESAGVPEAIDVMGKIVFDSSGFLPPLSKVAYKVLFGKKDKNNNLLLGTPTSRYVAINSSQDIFTYERTNLVFKLDENYLAQKTTLVTGNANNTNETNGTNPDSILLVSNADNLNKYAFWFDKGTGIAPTLVGYTPVKVDISALAPSDNVAPTLYAAMVTANMVDINVTINTNIITVTNLNEGITDGVTSPNNNLLTDIGGGWARTIQVTGTDSNYIKKFIKVHTKDSDFCFYFGNSRTITEVPDDPSLVGYTFVGIEIGNQSSKSFISNVASQRMRNALTGYYDVELNTSGINPIVTLIDVTGGNIEDVEQGDILTSTLEVVILNQGEVTEGQNANVEVSFTVPNGIDTTYFYRIYRTNTITVTEGLTLSDIDPGENCNLVFEGSVNVASGNKISVVDITNETFRNSGEPLYNNPREEGILQSNDVPPTAKDICNYKGFTFYANTKLNHQQTITAVSVDGIVAGSSKINIIKSGEDLLRTYTFRGTASKEEIVIGSYPKIHNGTNPDSKLFLYSANDETKYAVYFDDGTATTPTDVGFIPVKVTIEPSDPDYGTKFLSALSLLGDFDITVGVNNYIENAENGSNTQASTPNGIATDFASGWDLIRITDGEGEDAANGIALLSKSDSVGLKIERTIRSLVNVINADALGYVNAYYLSGVNDLPGKFILKARYNQDIPFYVTLDNISGDIFNPELAEMTNNVFTDIQIVNPTTIQIEYPAHGFTNNEEVYIGLPDCSPSILGVFKVLVVDTDNIQIKASATSVSVTNSYYFFPFESSDNLQMSNRIYYSKLNQPEAVPRINYIDVGTKDEPIERILSIRDYLFVLKTDGIYTVSGRDYGFDVDMLDTEKILCPDSAVVLNNQIYLMTNNGVITVNESSPLIISRMIENKFQVNNSFRSLVRRLGFGVSYTDDRAYILWLPQSATDISCSQAFRYNILEKTWTRWTKAASCGMVVDTGSSLMYIGDGDRPIVMQERKNLDRTDFADKDFIVQMGLDALIRNRYRLSDVSEIEAGDVITQKQYVNVDEFNRLLKKLDIDTGLNYTSFYSDFNIKTAENLASKLNSVNIKLVDLDTSGNVTIQSFDNSNWIEMQQKYNNLMDQLNLLTTVTAFKDYRHSEGYLQYEHVVTNVYTTSSEVQFFDETEFIIGDLIVYKAIKSVTVVNPISFGDASLFKQINKGYVLFDQNNFFKMNLEYKTDLSPSFEGSDFFGKGTGFWGSSTWGFKNKNYWGGDGSDAPRRVIIPRNKQRCRYITVKITHSTARDMYRIVGVAHDVRSVSARAYRF